MDGSGDHVRWNKPDWEDKCHVFFSQMQNLDFKKIHESRKGTIGGDSERGQGNKRGYGESEYDQSTLYTCMKPIILYN
jgi:hypothetical protein